MDIWEHATKRRDARDLETIGDAIRELLHCVLAGPEWFTQEGPGQRAHARIWAERGTEAIRKIQQTLEQAQDCLREETPEDCTPEEAKENTIAKIRESLGL